MQSCAKSGGNRCCYKNCNNSSSKRPSLSFFRFPVKDKERCITWILNSGNDELAELKETQLKSRVICSIHFKAEAFKNSKRNSLLQNNPLAIPDPWFLDDGPCETEPVQLPSVLTSSPVELHREKKENHETFEDFCNDFKPLTESIVENSPTPRKKKLMSIVSKQKYKIKSKVNALRFLKQKNNKVNIETIISSLKHFFSGEPLTFLTMQLRHLRKQNWNEEEKNLALSIYYKSPNVFNFLRKKGFKLPTLTQIRSWVNVNNVQPGFGQEVFDKLKRKSASMTEDEKECVILIDEMSIKQALEYDSKLDVVEGFQDLGPLGRERSTATHANVFMIRGLKHPWKCPIAYVLSHNSIKHTNLALLLDMCLSNLFESGLYPKAIVNDLGSTNAAAIRLLGASSDTPYIWYKDKKVYCLFDFPHLIKCVRNNLMKYDLLVEDKLVSWSDLQIFYEFDKSNLTDCRAAPKLTERHINPQCFQKMSVKLATQVFSHSVSRAMKTAFRLHTAFSSSTINNTAEFFGRMNDIFDCMNSKNLNEDNPLKKPLSKINLKALTCLENAIPYIQSWSVKGSVNPPCFDGIIQTIRGTLGLYYDMPEKCFLMTGRLNQDPIENLFSVIRQRSGYNSNPSAKEFRRNLQHAMSIRLLDPPDSSNCEADTDVNLQVNTENCSNISPPSENITVDNTSTTISLSEPDVSSQSGCTQLNINLPDLKLSPFEDNIIRYIAGWLAKKCTERFSCSNCKNSLVKETGSLLTNNETFIALKSFICHTGDLAKLVRPSEELVIVTKHQSWFFNESIKENLHVKNLRRCIEESIQKDTQDTYPRWWSACESHRLYMMKLLIKCKLHNSLRWKTNDIRDKVLKKSSKEKRAIQGNKLNPKLKKLKHL